MSSAAWRSLRRKLVPQRKQIAYSAIVRRTGRSVVAMHSTRHVFVQALPTVARPCLSSSARRSGFFRRRLGQPARNAESSSTEGRHPDPDRTNESAELIRHAGALDAAARDPQPDVVTFHLDVVFDAGKAAISSLRRMKPWRCAG